MFPQYSAALQQIALMRLPNYLLQGNVPPQPGDMPQDPGAPPDLRRSVYTAWQQDPEEARAQRNAPAEQDTSSDAFSPLVSLASLDSRMSYADLLQTHAMESASQGFDLHLFMHRAQPLNPHNPNHDAIAALDADSLNVYCLFAICQLSADTSNAALLLSLTDEDFEHIDAVRGYIAHETAAGTACDASPDWSIQSLDAPPSCQDLAPQDLGDVPQPFCAPGQPDAPPSYYRWLGNLDAYDDIDQVVLCAANHEDAQPCDWPLG